MSNQEWRSAATRYAGNAASSLAMYAEYTP